MTPKQKEVYDLLLKSELDGTPTPSYEELCIATGVKSKSGIHKIIHALESSGHIKKPQNRARAIRVSINISDFRRGYHMGLKAARGGQSQ